MKDQLYKIKSNIIRFFSNIRIYEGGIILFGDSHYAIKGPHMREILDSLLPGDVLLRRYDHYLGSVLIPGYFSHAALYVGANGVIHMLGEGICAEDILTFMRCDDIAVLRVKDTNLIKSAVGKAYDVKRTGTEYDFDFEANNKRFYCTEFVDYCFGNIVGKTLAAEEKIMPDDFLNEKLFNIVWRKQKK